MKKFILVEITDDEMKVLLKFTDIEELKTFLFEGGQKPQPSSTNDRSVGNQIKESLFGGDAKALRLGQSNHSHGRGPNEPW